MDTKTKCPHYQIQGGGGGYAHRSYHKNLTNFPMELVKNAVIGWKVIVFWTYPPYMIISADFSFFEFFIMDRSII